MLRRAEPVFLWSVIGAPRLAVERLRHQHVHLIISSLISSLNILSVFKHACQLLLDNNGSCGIALEARKTCIASVFLFLSKVLTPNNAKYELKQRLSGLEKKD